MKIESRFRKMIAFLDVGKYAVFGGTGIKRTNLNTYEVFGNDYTKTVKGINDAVSAAVDHWYSYHEKGE